MHADYDPDLHEPVLWEHLLDRGSVPVELRPFRAAIAADNPSITGDALMTRYMPLTGSAGGTAGAALELFVTDLDRRTS